MCMPSYNYMLTKIPAESIGCPEISVEEMIHSSHQNRLKKKRLTVAVTLRVNMLFHLKKRRGRKSLLYSSSNTSDVQQCSHCAWHPVDKEVSPRIAIGEGRQ